MARRKQEKVEYFEAKLEMAIQQYRNDFYKLNYLKKDLIDCYFINDNGEMCCFSHAEELNKQIQIYELRMEAHIYRIKELKWQVERRKK